MMHSQDNGRKLQIFIISLSNKANLRGLIAATSLVILLKLDSNHRFFCPCDLEILWMTSKIIVHLFYTMSSFMHDFKRISEFKLVTVRDRSIWVKIGDFFVPCDLEIWQVISEENRAPLLYYVKLCALFQSHGWIKTGIIVWKCSVRVKIGDLLPRVTLKFDRWPWKIKGHLFYTASSFVHLFSAIGKFKLELQSRNSQFGSKLTIFCSVWTWNLMDDLEKQ